jgi:hypothetical protein
VCISHYITFLCSVPCSSLIVSHFYALSRAYLSLSHLLVHHLIILGSYIILYSDPSFVVYILDLFRLSPHVLFLPIHPFPISLTFSVLRFMFCSGPFIFSSFPLSPSAVPTSLHAFSYIFLRSPHLFILSLIPFSTPLIFSFFLSSLSYCLPPFFVVLPCDCRYAINKS